ncbi:hypothetical protein AX17_000477 [Amanita inopinata Kibby_2008]|nr:hypothetical protein AX17_000477 [Amanita inopinata Kibby_2008]
MTHGKGREFKKLPTLTPEIIQSGHLQLLLFEAERAWAYAQELYNASLQPANIGQSRHSATGRFRRAVNWSAQLLSHCQMLHTSARLSAENLLQVTIYTLILNGRFLRYRDEFEDALPQLSVAHSLLDELAASASTSRDQALATLFVDEISPEIRHCAHELGRQKAYDVNGIIADVTPAHKEQLVEGHDALVEKLRIESKVDAHAASRKQLRDIFWEGQRIPIRNPELVDVLLKVQEEETKLSMRDEPLPGESMADKKKRTKKENRTKKGVAAYDAILLALSDAENVARKLKEAQQLSGAGSKIVQSRQDIPSANNHQLLPFVHAYIVYQLLSRRIERDLLLVSAILANQPGSRPGMTRSSRMPAPNTLKPEQVDSRLYPAVVRVLDTVLQSLNQMRSLSIIDDNPDLAAAVEARASFTRARRCLYLARCYTPVRKYAEALSLLQHANIHVRETISTFSLANRDPISDMHPCFFPLNNTDMKELEAGLVADGLQFKRDWFTHNGGALDQDMAKTYKKPVFFNIALNYVELGMDRLLERAGKKPPSPGPVQAVPGSIATVQQPTVTIEKKVTARAKVEEVQPATPEPQAPPRSGLSNLLGGWWGRS